jgi:hypothetical protein
MQWGMFGSDETESADFDRHIVTQTTMMVVSLLGGQSRANHRGVIKLGQQI